MRGKECWWKSKPARDLGPKFWEEHLQTLACLIFVSTENSSPVKWAEAEDRLKKSGCMAMLSTAPTLSRSNDFWLPWCQIWERCLNKFSFSTHHLALHPWWGYPVLKCLRSSAKIEEHKRTESVNTESFEILEILSGEAAIVILRSIETTDMFAKQGEWLRVGERRTELNTRNRLEGAVVAGGRSNRARLETYTSLRQYLYHFIWSKPCRAYPKFSA